MATDDPFDIEDLLAEIDALDEPPEQPDYAMASKPQREVTTREELDEIMDEEWPRETEASQQPCDDQSCAVPESRDDAQAAEPIPESAGDTDDVETYEPFPLPDQRPDQSPATPALPDFGDDPWEDVELPRTAEPVESTAEPVELPRGEPVESADFPEFEPRPGETLDARVPEGEQQSSELPESQPASQPSEPASIPPFADAAWEDVPLPQMRRRRAPATSPVRTRRPQPAPADFPEFEPDEDRPVQVPSRVRETASSVPEPGDPPGDGPTARAPSTVPQQRDMGVAVTHNVVLSGDRELAEEFAQQLIPALGEMREGILAQVQDMIESNTAVLDRSRGVV